ncbi:MAG: DNA (cytosine-5-)-methyltransferase [Pseudomonadota bacterium]|nr:DNA (cytosine-5-)-methyltransferase [Pseudomonadota bacterium]
MRYLSLFSGMEAAHLAWAPLGWECAGVAEIEPAACQLLAHRLPNVPNLGSVTDITDEQIAALGQIDVVIGGSPCQDLSVAGKRAGLGGARSGLFHQQLRIFHAARHLCGARWLVWENVPGAFSSNRGLDFAVVAGEMAGCELPVPADGWGSEGLALGDNGLVEWAVLDAQWFGVAQRRRRVFAILDTGDWANRRPVLLERESLRGDSAPRRESWKDVAPTISARTSGGGGLGADFDLDGGLIPELARCVTTGEAKRQDWETCTIIPAIAHTLNTQHGATEDETGGGTPLVPVAFYQDQASAVRFTVPAQTLSTRCGQIANEQTYLLTSDAIAFGGQMSSVQTDVELSQTLQAKNPQAVAIGFVPKAPPNSRSMGEREEQSPTITTHQNGQGVFAGMAVRRLTPRECERLQGATDDHTLVPNKHGKPMADGPRYKMLGNSFAVPVIHWIGRQIDHATNGEHHGQGGEVQAARVAA